MTEPVYDQQDADNYYLATENRNLRKRIEELEQQIAALRAEIARSQHLWQQADPFEHCTCGHRREGHHVWGPCHAAKCKCSMFVHDGHGTAEAQLAALQAENEKLQQRNDNQFAIISDFSSQLRALQEKL